MPTSNKTKDNLYIAGRWTAENLGWLFGVPRMILQSGFKNQDGRRKYRMHKIGTCDTEQCAAWANSQMRKTGRQIYGNAWNTTGATILVDGYNGIKRPSSFNYFDVQKYNSLASQNLKNNFDLSKLDTNKTYMQSQQASAKLFQEFEKFNFWS